MADHLPGFCAIQCQHSPHSPPYLYSVPVRQSATIPLSLILLDLVASSTRDVGTMHKLPAGMSMLARVKQKKQQHA